MSFSGGAIDSFTRFIVYYDKQCNGAAPAMTDLLLANSLYSPKSLANVRRFKILYDQLGQVELTGNDGSMVTYERYRRMNLRTEFNTGVAGTIADITTGSLYLVIMGSNAAGGNAFATAGSARVRYTDQ